jgi:hypothetical protein
MLLGLLFVYFFLPAPFLLYFLVNLFHHFFEIPIELTLPLLFSNLRINHIAVCFPALG